MKTLDDIKQEYARENNFCEWSEILYSTDDPAEIDDHFDKVAKLFALEACKESLRIASENARVMTKNIDTENELEVLSWTDSRNVKFSVSKQSILSETNIPEEVRNE